MTTVAALVPMRHHSQRVPGKNYRELAGKPLFHHILFTLQAVPELEGIFVDTDSPVIQEGIQESFPSVRVIDRPERLRADEISMNEILAYDMSQIQADLYLQTHSTNPLLRADTLSKAIQHFREGMDHYDSLFSVTRLQTRLYDTDGLPLNHDPGELIQTQDLPPVYEENSCIYLFTENSLSAFGHRIGKSPCMFEIDPQEAWDIDTELDFEIVDCLMKKTRE
jgi:CMP-N-acetylneuraminic acid synthetase